MMPLEQNDMPAIIGIAVIAILAALLSEGRFRRAYLGIAGGPRPLPPRLARELGRETGVEVVEVVEGSPAAAAGRRPPPPARSRGARIRPQHRASPAPGTAGAA